MSASRSLPISTAMPANASQRWSATRSVRGVLERSSMATAASEIQLIRGGASVPILSVGEHAALRGEEVGRGLDDGVGAGQGGEEEIGDLGRGVLDDLRSQS